MRTTQEAVDLIKEWEGLRLHSYYCPAGKLTIGYGCTRDVTEGMTISEEEADMRLIRDIAETEQRITDILGQRILEHLTDNQISALTSFVFNVGLGRFKASTMLKYLNALDLQYAAGEFERWCHISGEISVGLQARRSAERELFNRPDGKERNWLLAKN